jgi:hypothetical protein
MEGGDINSLVISADGYNWGWEIEAILKDES